jgi:outer membrane protein OmpA-like peptidoglycan-associated protein
MKRLLTFLFAIWLFHPLSTGAQNLIRNGSFETHAAMQCLNCNLGFGKYPAIMSHWDNAGWGCVICDVTYNRNSDDIKANICPYDKVKPKEGKTMIQMWYDPSCGGDVHEGATYLSQRTSESMEVGKLYEISFWIYIESRDRTDPEGAKHIGITLLPQNLKMHGLYQKELILPFLPIDTVQYDVWYPVKWRVRPLCTSNYLMVGVYKANDWPEKRWGLPVHYWLDQVSVVEVPGAKAVADSSVYYCSKYDPVALGVPPMLDQQTLLFQNDAYELTTAHQTILDSFAVQIKKYPQLVFEISGHTDSIGSNNQVLSEKRAQTVLDYFTQQHQIPPLRFITLAKAGKDPAQSNQTEAGRIQNRRVLVRQSELGMRNAWYRAALRAMEAQRIPEVFTLLNQWSAKPDLREGTPAILLFDPRFESLHKDQRWKTIEQKVRATYRSLKYAQQAFLLDSMRLAEQCATANLTVFQYQKGFNALPGYVPFLDTVFLEMEPQPEAVIHKIRSGNYARLLQFMQKTGWPKTSEWGESASASAFAIFMSAPNLVDQLKWLPELKKRCEEGEAPWLYYAKLYDHCNLSLGKPQRYCTVMDVYEYGKIAVKPWEGDIKTVNEQRAKIGLPLLDWKVEEAMKEGAK